MTPQLQQATPAGAVELEVEGFIAEEIERNPLLDSAGSAEDGPSEPTEIETPRATRPPPSTIW